jgi:hypothetical protein
MGSAEEEEAVIRHRTNLWAGNLLFRDGLNFKKGPRMSLSFLCAGNIFAKLHIIWYMRTLKTQSFPFAF